MVSLSPTDIGNACPERDYKTTWNGDLATHLKSVHRGQTFLCQEHDTTLKGNLARLLKSVHRGQSSSVQSVIMKPHRKVILLDI